MSLRAADQQGSSQKYRHTEVMRPQLTDVKLKCLTWGQNVSVLFFFFFFWPLLTVSRWERGGVTCSKGPQHGTPIRGCCSEDKASAHGTLTLPTELNSIPCVHTFDHLIQNEILDILLSSWPISVAKHIPSSLAAKMSN